MFSFNADKVQRYTKESQKQSDEAIQQILEITPEEVEMINSLEEEEAPKDKLYDSFSKNIDLFYSMTGFTVQEFDTLFSIVGDSLTIQGRGRKGSITPPDILILLLHYFRRYPKYEVIRSVFHIPESSFETILNKYLPLLCQSLVENFINKPKESCSIPYDQKFPNCGYIVDARVQEIYVPSRSFELAKKFFSGKHYCYCLKSQVIVTLKGQAVHVVTSINGSVHDKKVFDDSLQDFNDSVIKFHQGEPSKIIGDKGYQDNNSDILITPFKGSAGDLNHDQMKYNHELGKVRIIVENFFGRLKMRYDIMKYQYRGMHEKYEYYFLSCCALVNFEILMCDHPLREEDGEFYQKLCASIKEKHIHEKKHSAENKKRMKERRMQMVDSNYKDSE